MAETERLRVVEFASMAAITAAMVWEVTPWGGGTVKLIGYALLAAGLIVLAGPLPGPLIWPG